jgi:SAM-dependent methyltransferase
MITETGIWSEDEAKYHIHSEQLLNYLIEFLNKDLIVLDFGCGDGYYISSLKDNGFEVRGIDGSTLSNTYYSNIIHEDLSEPIILRSNGQVLSFEVGEHIPEQFEQVFIDNLIEHCNSRLIISWAIPGQGGIGHVNCKSNEYIINEITKRGFTLNGELTSRIRQGDYKDTPWFYNTLLVFDKNG